MPYSKDTRTIAPGDTYVAIRGERHDGHEFVREAVRKGASAVVIERPVAGLPSDVHVSLVDNSEKYLADRASRKVLNTGARVVGITGSMGKTSTKNAIAAVLSRRSTVLSTPGNLNTPLGVSLTVLNAHIDHGTILVLEMGATRKGDIAELCRYFRPVVAVVTNVHGVHLSSFGSVENVAEAKAEIIRSLSSAGTACLNHDAPLVRDMVQHHGGRTIYYGHDAGCEVRPEHITATMSLLGPHVVYIALATLAAARALGVDDNTANGALAGLKPERGRLNALPGIGQSTLIDDTYNASPVSTEAALTALEAYPARRRIAILGDMLELGDKATSAHAAAIRLAVTKADKVILVGPLMKRAFSSMPDLASGPLQHFALSRDAALAIASADGFNPEPGDVVLLKGSQGVRMEHVTKALLRRDIVPGEVLVRQAKSWQQV